MGEASREDTGACRSSPRGYSRCPGHGQGRGTCFPRLLASPASHSCSPNPGPPTRPSGGADLLEHRSPGPPRAQRHRPRQAGPGRCQGERAATPRPGGGNKMAARRGGRGCQGRGGSPPGRGSAGEAADSGSCCQPAALAARGAQGGPRRSAVRGALLAREERYK